MQPKPSLLLIVAALLGASLPLVDYGVTGDYWMATLEGIRRMLIIFGAFGLGVTLGALRGEIDTMLSFAASFAFGGFVGSTIVLFVHPRGPGNLFPVAMAISFTLIFMAVGCGFLAAMFVRAFRR